MARRKRNNDNWIFELAPLIALPFALACLHPGLRAGMISLGISLLWLAGGALILFIVGRILWKQLSRKTTPTHDWNSSVLEVNPPISEPVGLRPAMERASVTAEPKQMADQLRALDWFQFEKVVEVLYRQLGYSVDRRGGAKPDGGIDLVIEKDGQRSAIQCKQWKTWNVGVKPVREFLGALTDSGIQRGIFITLAGYTADAKQLAEKHGIEVVNERELVRMLEQSDARYNPELISAFNDTRKMCPKCESEMVIRTASRGAGVGGQFWGCSTYPRCRYTMAV